MRVRLYDTQVQAGPDLAVIQTNWEKRCLMLPAFTPRIDSGFSTFLMHKDKTGWGMAALSGANPFESSGTLATLVATSGTTCSLIANSQVQVSTQPFTITLNDPDLAGAPSVNVIVITSQGDRETFTLHAAAGGTFTLSSLPFSVGAPAANGSIDVTATLVSGYTYTCSTVITVIYTDTTTPNGMPQAVQASVRLP
jgi:hypothetical protein